MKIKYKRPLIKTLLALSILIIVGKLYFEIDHDYYKSKLENMKNIIELTTTIKSTIEHKTLEINNFTIHYFVSGKDNKEPIVFLHPAFSDHRAFDQQVDYFSENYKVITIDLIGHGLSKANKSQDKIDASTEHIFKILETESIDKANFVGVSIGSLIAQYFAFKYASKVKSLTALGGYNIHKESKEIEKAQRGSNFGLIFRALFSMNAFRKKTALITCKSEIGQALFYNTTSHYKRKSFMVMQGLQNVVKNRESVEINYPTLIITGEHDIDLAIKMATNWRTTLQQSEYFIIKNGGHCANIDEPIIFNERVSQFLHKNKTDK